MPLMDGFEFLEEFKNLDFPNKDAVVIVFLTTSGADKDKIQSSVNELIYKFIEKPLRKKELLKLRDEYLKGIEQ